MAWIRLMCCAVALLGASATTYAGDRHDGSAVPAALDLAADARLATRQRVPLLLVFEQEHCAYCEKLDREVLNPYQRTGAFAGKAVVRRLMLDSFTTIAAFDGKPSDARSLARSFRVDVTPTLLFVDAHGHEVAERIIGISSTDFFAAYLEQYMDAAREKIREH